MNMKSSETVERWQRERRLEAKSHRQNILNA